MITADLAGRLQRAAGPAARWLNRVAQIFVALMMVLTGIDVAMRYFFNHPIPGSYELTQFMMPAAVGFGLAFCAFEEGHVQVDLVTGLLPRRLQNLLKSLAYLAMLAVYLLITWQAVERARGMMASGQYTEVLYLPIYPFALVVAVGCLCVCLVALGKFFHYLNMALSPI